MAPNRSYRCFMQVVDPWSFIDNFPEDPSYEEFAKIRPFSHCSSLEQALEGLSVVS